MDLQHLFIAPTTGFQTVSGSYSISLVTLSVVIAVVTSTLALNCLKTAREDTRMLLRSLQILAGSIALAGGTWSMHFIGMIAYELPINVDYNVLGTAFSMLPMMLAGAITLGALVAWPSKPGVVLGGGVLLGVGIGLMHYSGMMAMEMDARMVYDPFRVLISVLVAPLASVFALWLGCRKQPVLQHPLHDLLLRGGILGGAISSMHYVGMSAVTIYTERFPTDSTDPVSHPVFAMLVAVVTISIITAVTTGNMLIRLRLLQRENDMQKRRMEAVLDTAVDGIITIDSRGLIESMNPAAEKMLGWPLKEIAGQNISLLMPAPYKNDHDGYLHNYLQTSEARIIGSGREVMAQHRDGRLIPIRLGVGEVKLPDQPPLFVGFITDISEQRRMQGALRESEQQFRSLLANMPGVAFRCLTDNPWSMLFISDAVEELTGWPPQDFIDGRIHMADLIHEEDLAHCEQNVSAAIEQRTSYSFEYRIHDRQGVLRWVLDSGDFEFSEGNNAEWIDGVLLDITERKKIEDELRRSKQAAEEAAQAKATFLANMSHEIRTPMNAIIGFSDIMREGSLDTEQQRYIDSISSAARSLLSLLNDILDSAKLERGKLELEVIDFSLHELLDSLVSTYWLTARKKGLALRLSLDEQMPDYFRGAPDRIRQVLTNLLGNAIKFTETGSVELNVFRNQTGDLEFQVRDTGIGMSEQARARIFEPFTQADASMSRRFGGTGLGTTISKQLVDLMGGDISVTSEVGVGSCFSVTLPLTPGSQPQQNASEPASASDSLPALNILIADDINQNLELLEVILGRDGHRTTRANDGHEALQRLNEARFDLILMDVQMPNMDGLSAAREIRAQEARNGLPGLPIIALTASVLEADKQAAKEAGMNGFVHKPVEPALLKAEIARVITGRPANAVQVSPPSSSRRLINLERALALWGDESRYISQLSHFLVQKPDQALRDALSNANFEEMRQLAHAAAGVSGNLSLARLSRHFSKLEASALGEDRDNCAALICELGALLTRVRAELQELESSLPAEPAPTAHLDERNTRTFYEAINAARTLCEHGEIDDEVNARMQAHCPDEYCPQVAEAVQALEDFDFPHARDLLNRIPGDTETLPS